MRVLGTIATRAGSAHEVRGCRASPRGQKKIGGSENRPPAGFDHAPQIGQAAKARRVCRSLIRCDAKKIGTFLSPRKIPLRPEAARFPLFGGPAVSTNSRPVALRPPITRSSPFRKGIFRLVEFTT